MKIEILVMLILVVALVSGGQRYHEKTANRKYKGLEIQPNENEDVESFFKDLGTYIWEVAPTAKEVFRMITSMTEDHEEFIQDVQNLLERSDRALKSLFPKVRAFSKRLEIPLLNELPVGIKDLFTGISNSIIDTLETTGGDMNDLAQIPVELVEGVANAVVNVPTNIVDIIQDSINNTTATDDTSLQ